MLSRRLFNLADDRSEENGVAESHPEIDREMGRLSLENDWMSSVAGIAEMALLPGTDLTVIVPEGYPGSDTDDTTDRFDG